MIDISTYRVRVGCFILSCMGKSVSGKFSKSKHSYGSNFTNDFFTPSHFPSFDATHGSYTLIRVGGAEQVFGPISFLLSYFYMTFLSVIISLHLLSPPVLSLSRSYSEEWL